MKFKSTSHGKWYQVEYKKKIYNVVLPDVRDASTILVFDENLDKVKNYKIWDVLEDGFREYSER